MLLDYLLWELLFVAFVGVGVLMGLVVGGALVVATLGADADLFDSLMLDNRRPASA